jgi:adenylyltransferase/sulfurtransferase
MTPLAGSADLRRYSRHLLVPEVGLAGQQRLANARVLCVGAGGLGSPVIAYLAAAGVGRLGIVDDDAVDLTNLQRQVLYATADVGASKAHTAAARARALNPQIAVDAYPIRLDAGNAVRSSSSTDSSRSSARAAARVIAACIPSLRPRISCPRARTAACSAP